MIKFKKQFLNKKLHSSRFQFNAIALTVTLLGFILGSIYIIQRIQYEYALAFNETTQIWTFDTTNAPNYTYDNTLVTVDNSGARPVTGVNKITNPAFASNNSSWNLAAVAGSTTPDGWVVVPGSSTHATSDFLVMKYEAKCADTSDLATGLTVPDSGHHTYLDANMACTSANSKAVVSVASGYSIAYVSQTEAITRCSTVIVGGATAHLISNNEWMTVARNAEAQASNWSLGSVGSGYLFAGHNDNAPSLALIASTTDTGNNACAYTDTAGTTEAPASCPTNTANNTSSTVGNQKRVLTMSNGSYIWDIAGNVGEWTNDTIQGKDQPTGATPGANWREFTALTTYGTLTYDKVRPANVLYDATYGMGRIFSDGTASNTTVYAFIRGNSWMHTDYAGAFAADLGSPPGGEGWNLGFRCASDPVALSHSFSSSSGREAAGGDSVTVGSVTDAKIYQSINVGNTSTYDISAYAYDSTSGNVGGIVTSSIAQLYYNGAAISTTYTDAGSGWWKLSGTLTGADASREYGVLVKSGKTIGLDDFTLSKSGPYSVYTTAAYSNAQVFSWNSFAPTVTASGNATVGYQLCLDNGSDCSYSSGSRWQYYTGGVWTNATDATQTSSEAQLTQTAMQALSTTSKKITVKAIMGFGGADTPTVSSITIGLTLDISPPTVPGTPTTTTPTNDSTPTWTWTASTDSGSGLATNAYSLQWCQDADFAECGSNIATATTNSYSHSFSLDDGTWYIKVKAIDVASNESAYSSNGQVIIDTTVPSIPTDTLIDTPTGTLTDTPTGTPTDTPTETPTDTVGVVTLPPVTDYEDDKIICPTFSAFSVSPTVVKVGTEITVKWETKNATKVYWQDNKEEVAPNSSKTLQPTSSTTVQLLADNGICIAKVERDIQVVKSMPWENSTIIGAGALIVEAAIIQVSALYTGTANGGIVAFQQAGTGIQGNIWLALASFLERKRKKKWGIVYDAVTKKPLARVVVRLIEVSSGKVVDTSVTDAQGLLRLYAPVGKYLVTVKHPQYNFPSTLVKETIDGGYAGVYRGEIIEIASTQTTVLISIPLDPIKLSGALKLKVQGVAFVEKIGNIGSFSILGVGLLYSSYAAIAYPHMFNYVAVSMYLLLLTAKTVLTTAHPKIAGTVKTQGGDIVSGIEIGLYDKEFMTLVYRTFTNAEGKYVFFVVGGNYRLQIMDNRYKLVLKGKQVDGIDIFQKEKNDTHRFIVEDFILSKIG
ncbi:hypothetical protein CO112_01130 [Candidatus Dojkabacteria bacterium CG_4_9_14_3_um_filter_150_Dojkabacteria_WS6_41_13]|nr:MAG: hypothetical protein CO112_01130 [Candidatus Dojkabacteria bacterium CG_4_9_14_3_um_filter_150_Dojkabacteria_WS6_41_13]